MVRKLLNSVAIAALAAGAANAQQHFTFSEQMDTYSGAGLVTGSFDGTLSGNLITNLSHISVFIDGVAFAGNGALFGSHYDNNWDWVSGGAVASLDGSQNNFLFINSDYPNDINYSNYYYSIFNGSEEFAESWSDPNNNQYAFNEVSPTSFHAQVASVPEPASWALMVAGFGLAGTGMRIRRRKAAIRFA